MRRSIPDQSFPQLEEQVLAFWREHETFHKSLSQRANRDVFSTTDGPPFATGLPHYGHLLAGTIKDTVLRYKTMKGFSVPRRFGWDCHGLPIENEVEKNLGLSGGASIEAYGIDKFNEACRAIVLRYAHEWQETVHRMGRWVDFDNSWHTMDLSYMETVWWVFKRLYDRGLVYRGFRVMPVSTKLGTPLSNFEAGSNYQEVDDPSITLTLPLINEPNTALLVWTTTPWTLPSNLAAMVGPEVLYVKLFDRTRDKFFILAEGRVSSLFPDPSTYEIRARFPGSQLVGEKYTPPFDYFAHRHDAFRVIPSEAVSTEEGTGIVHAAPAFGEADYEACRAAEIELVCPVTINGIFTRDVPDLEGQQVKETDRTIVRHLRRTGRLFHETQLRHRYPFCWRSDTPLIYRALETWFVRVEDQREALLNVNDQIHWTPSHIKEGRFGKWLGQARDWNIARNRYWGTPIPVWINERGEHLVVGSLAELEKLTGVKATDIHRHHIDHLTISKDNTTYRRIPEVFDCWFESGSAPYAQDHYPFENKEQTERQLPVDFIAEGLDQTRGWFYTLTVLATALFNKPAFRNVIVNGILLAEDGAKMSKRLKNYPEPSAVIHRYGADAVRLYMLNSPAARADDLRFSEHGVELIMRQVLLPLWNAYSFLATYARIYDWTPPETLPAPTTTIDRWLVSIIQKLVQEVQAGLEDYDLSRSVDPLIHFIEQLTNWYIRLNRRRFWEKGALPDDEDAFSFLHHALITLAKVAAPFVPFLTETVYQHLRSERMPESVHLCDYPFYDEGAREPSLEDEMAAAQAVVSLGHALRKQHQLKVRQPLRALYIATHNQQIVNFLHDQQHLVAAELNVKEVHLTHDEQQFVQLTAKPNFRTLGKKVGAKMRAVQQAIAALDQSSLSALRRGESITLSVEGEELIVSPDDVLVERTVREGLDAINQGEITVALDTTLTDELLLEGLARELVNKVSSMRRESKLDYTDRITLVLKATPRVEQAVSLHHAYVEKELLARSITFAATEGQPWDLNGEAVVIAISKVN